MYISNCIGKIADKLVSTYFFNELQNDNMYTVYDVYHFYNTIDDYSSISIARYILWQMQYILLIFAYVIKVTPKPGQFLLIFYGKIREGKLIKI